MNVRISTQSFKFKITNEELENLLSGETINVNTSLFAVRVQVSNQFFIEIENKNIILNVTEKNLESLKGMGRNRDGVTTKCNDDKVTLQVDFRKNNA